MSDQRNALNKILADLLRKINTSIQKTSCYVEQNTFNFGADAAAETSSVGGALGFLGVLTIVPGTTDGLSGAGGTLSVSTSLGSKAVEIAASSDVTISGDLDVTTTLVSSIVEVVGISGTLSDLDVSTNLVGSAAGVGGGEGFLNHQLLSGEVAAGIGGGSAELDVLTAIVGETVAESSASGGTMYIIL